MNRTERAEKKRQRDETRREFSRLMREKNREMNRRIAELQMQYHDEIHAAYHGDANRRGRTIYRRYHRHIKYTRPFMIIFSLVVWIIILFLGGFPFWFRVLIVVLVALSTARGIGELVFLFRMDKRILDPLDRLEDAAREIASGNYDVVVESSEYPETAALIRTFNDMAQALKKSEELKREYEQNRKDLIANISHDLKTPVTSVLGYIDAVHDIGSVAPEKIEKYLTIIKSNTVYINRLIDDLFLFSRLDIDRLNMSFEHVHVRNFLRDMMEEFSFDFEEQGIRFEYRDLFPADSAGKVQNEPDEVREKKSREFFVRIDPKFFSRIIRNLFDNARKYGPEQRLHIEVTAGVSKSDFFITVADNGPGLSEDAVAHLFERFFRADPERTKHTASTGLGLAIAKELTEAQGGTISAKNREVGGLVFTIFIPLDFTDQD